MDLENIVVDITQRNYNTIQTIQYDVDSRYVNVKIVSSGKNVDLTNYMVSIACKKPDGKIVFNETEMIEPKQGLIKFLISEQISVALGEVVCELKIYGRNSSVLTTQYFTINVTQPIADKAIQSTNEFRQLTIAMNDYNAWVDKVKDKYEWLEEEYAERLTEISTQLSKITTLVDKYEHLNTGGTWDNAIDEALSQISNGGEILFSNKTYLISKPIRLKTNQTIRGVSRYSTIKLKDNMNCNVVELFSSKEKRCEIHNLTIDGNMNNQTSTDSNGIVLSNDYTHESFDIRHVVNNVFIIWCKGDGLKVTGRGESIFSKIQVQEVGKNGFNIDCWDSFFENLSAGHCGESGVLLNGANSRLTTCKVWGSDVGVTIKGNKMSLTNVDIQDVVKYGFDISGKGNSIYSSNIDAVGWDEYNDVKFAESVAVRLNSGADYNMICSNVCDRAEFSNTGSLDYVLECHSNFNHITIMARDILTGAVKNQNIIENNIIRVKGQKKDNTYLNYTTKYEDLEVLKSASGRGFTIGANDTKNYIAPVENHVSQWNNALHYENNKWTVANTIAPRNASTDLGDGLANSFRRLYLNSGLICGELEYTPIGISHTSSGDLWLNGITIKKGSNKIEPYNDLFEIGDANRRIKNIYLTNSPNVASKRELKDNIKLFDDAKAYDNIKNLPIYTYNYKRFDKDGNVIGLDAENMLGSLLDELPIECINEQAQGVDLYAYTSYCISALKTAIKKIEELEKKIETIG